MRMQKKRNYSEIARSSVRSDFAAFERKPQQVRVERISTSGEVKRIAFVNANSGYFKYKHLLVGKQVRLLREASFGGWFCSFLFDEDRRALNNTAGWSENKTEFLLDGVKFK